MKGESSGRHHPRSRGAPDPETVAAQAFAAIAGDAERLARFLGITGLDGADIRRAAAEPGFLSSVLDYVAADEALLVAIAGELDLRPDAVAAAQARLSPAWDPDG